MELNFGDIISGKEPKNQQKAKQSKKMTQTDTRKRQQSCMVSQVDKDLLPSNTNTNPVNFRVSLSDMLQIDTNDESLETYKKNLLGDIKEQDIKQEQPAQVEILKIQIVSPTLKKPIVLAFKDHDPKTTRKFTIKEGSTYCMKIYFNVRYDLVFGLKFVNNVYKAFAKVDKDEDKMGSFAPQSQPHVFDLPWTQAPQGFLARGDYKGKGLFLDNDGMVHCQFDYVMTIGSEW